MTDQEYFAHPAISNSDLQYFNMYGAANFYEYKFGNKGKENSENLKLGSLFHCMVLEPEKLEERYIVCETTPNHPNQHKFISLLLEGYSTIEAYTNSYSTKGKKIDEIERSSIELREKLNLYHLAVLENKEIIDQEMFSKASEMKKALDKSNWKEIICKQYPLLFEGSLAKELNERAVIYKDELSGLQLKSKIDRLLLFEERKTFLHIDLKTTQYSNSELFRESIKKYKYDQQIAFYRKGILEIIKEGYGGNCGDWKGVSVIIACQSNPPYPIEIYEFSNISIFNNENSIKQSLDKLKRFLIDDPEGKDYQKWSNIKEINVV